MGACLGGGLGRISACLGVGLRGIGASDGLGKGGRGVNHLSCMCWGINVKLHTPPPGACRERKAMGVSDFKGFGPLDRVQVLSCRDVAGWKVVAL